MRTSALPALAQVCLGERGATGRLSMGERRHRTPRGCRKTERFCDTPSAPHPSHSRTRFRVAEPCLITQSRNIPTEHRFCDTSRGPSADRVRQGLDRGSEAPSPTRCSQGCGLREGLPGEGLWPRRGSFRSGTSSSSSPARATSSSLWKLDRLGRSLSDLIASVNLATEICLVPLVARCGV